MAFKCEQCQIYQGSKARYKGGKVCKKCIKLSRLEVKLKEIYNKGGYTTFYD